MRSAYDRGLTILGGGFDLPMEDDEVVFGMFDIAQAQLNMNALKPVSVEIGRILLRNAQQVIGQSIMAAKQPWYKSDLPGDTARKNVQAHLAWHANALAGITTDPNSTVYASGDDLKKWAMQAFIEANAVEEGAAWLDSAWQSMWDEIRTALEKIPKAIVQAAAAAVKEVGGALGSGVAAGLGIPTWLFWIGAAAAAAGVGYVGYKVITGPAGGVLLGRYLR